MRSYTQMTNTLRVGLQRLIDYSRLVKMITKIIDRLIEKFTVYSFAHRSQKLDACVMLAVVFFIFSHKIGW